MACAGWLHRTFCSNSAVMLIHTEHEMESQTDRLIMPFLLGGQTE